MSDRIRKSPVLQYYNSRCGENWKTQIWRVTCFYNNSLILLSCNKETVMISAASRTRRAGCSQEKQSSKRIADPAFHLKAPNNYNYNISYKLQTIKSCCKKWRRIPLLLHSSPRLQWDEEMQGKDESEGNEVRIKGIVRNKWIHVAFMTGWVVNTKTFFFNRLIV